MAGTSQDEPGHDGRCCFAKAESRDAAPVAETSPEAMLAAADLATDHQLGIWDAVILSAASRSGCRLLLSDDLQEDFTWAGVTVVNPFASPQQRSAAGALGGGDDE